MAGEASWRHWSLLRFEKLGIVGTESLTSLLSPPFRESSEARLSMPTTRSLSQNNSKATNVIGNAIAMLLAVMVGLLVALWQFGAFLCGSGQLWRLLVKEYRVPN